jgi:hypothetical protein
MFGTNTAGRNIWIEINASPERLDLGANLIRTAKARGARSASFGRPLAVTDYENRLFAVKSTNAVSFG